MRLPKREEKRRFWELVRAGGICTEADPAMSHELLPKQPKNPPNGTYAAVCTMAIQMPVAGPKSERPTTAAVKHGAIWNIATGAIAVVSGLAPHVLHHAGLLIGVALFSGALGTSIFGVLGFAASIPFLVRLRRRFGTWRAPAIAVVIFAAMFTLSAVVIGPAISATRNPLPQTQPTDHAGHHG